MKEEKNTIEQLVGDILSGNHQGLNTDEIKELLGVGLTFFHIHTLILIGKSKK